MSHPPRTPVPDRPEPVALGRRAALGALVCLIVFTGLAWALGTRIWQRVQPAIVAWDDVPMAIELPPDRVHAIARGKADPAELLDSVLDTSSTENRSGSRLEEERRLLTEMFPQHATTQDISAMKAQPPGQATRPASPTPSVSTDQPLPKREVSSTGNEPEFPQRFSGHGSVLPSAALRIRNTYQTAATGMPVHDPQVVQATSATPLPKLANTLAESAKRLERQPPVVPMVHLSGSNDAVGVSDIDKGEKLITVGEGESFWTIAQQIYGDGNYFQAIYFENQEQIGNYEDLAAGQQLRCPTSGSLRQKYPDLFPVLQLKPEGPLNDSNGGQVYCTIAGDTLFEVARQQLGQASRYMEIAILNRTVLGESIGHLDPLPEGLKLVLPKPVP